MLLPLKPVHRAHFCLFAQHLLEQMDLHIVRRDKQHIIPTDSTDNATARIGFLPAQQVPSQLPDHLGFFCAVASIAVMHHWHKKETGVNAEALGPAGTLTTRNAVEGSACKRLS